ncbi:MAG: MopE-related protein [Myxococcota bacterium]|nr:MopE-related protein [Myxococcota bacterium]
MDVFLRHADAGLIRLGLHVFCMSTILFSVGCAGQETEVRVQEKPIKIKYSACLSTPEGEDVRGCRSTLHELTHGQELNACLTLEVDGGPESRHQILKWDGENAVPISDRVDVQEGQSLRGMITFFPKDVDATSLCKASSATIFTERCDDPCLFTLRSQTIVLGEDYELDFVADDGACRVEWASENGPAEICNGVDDDCDGEADEQIADVPTCRVGTGDCQVEGTEVCVGGQWAMCDAVAAEPGREVAGGGDEDCDGSVDEVSMEFGCGLAGTIEPCASTRPACLAGLRECLPNGDWGPCLDESGIAISEAEICDGIDNDCDGRSDEDYGGDQNRQIGLECVVIDALCRQPGVYTCGRDGLFCQERETLIRDEVCNGCDDDGDGLVDESGAGGLLERSCYAAAQETLGVGECRSGVQTCFEGSYGPCRGSVTPRPEQCNEVDNDCDGLTDEGLRNECGACGEDPDEECDEIDNDCDGLVDEGFELRNNRFQCGRCDLDCTANARNAEVQCVNGSCVIAQCLNRATDDDGDPLNGCECVPGAADRPDPRRVDSNCDGIDGQLSRAVLARVSGNDAGRGDANSPVSSLRRAIELAIELNLDQIYLETGNYTIPAELTVDDATRPFTWPDGVSIYGGFEAVAGANGALSWSRPAQPRAPTIVYVRQDGLKIADLTRRSEFEAISIRTVAAANAEPSSSIGIIARNVGNHLFLRDVEIRTNDASAGADGADAADHDSPAGEQGEVGEPARGGAGGRARECGAFLTSPGSGGAGGDPGNQGALGTSVDPGVLAALGGASGANALSGGADGGDGQPGAHGANGLPSQPDGEVDASGLWQPHVGAAPRPGKGGNGGGGGGGHGIAMNGLGTGGGGGGGAGGCGGREGQQGQSGYGSIGLIIIGGRVNSLNLRIVTGSGGAGGDGGRGSIGQSGGQGGRGAMGDNMLCGGDCQDGGDGGRGGPGGCGGHGSGGSGGISVGVLRVAPRIGELDASSLIQLPVIEGEFPRGPNQYDIGVAGLPGRGVQGDVCGEASPDGTAGLRLEIGCCHAGPGGGPCGTVRRRGLSCD